MAYHFGLLSFFLDWGHPSPRPETADKELESDPRLGGSSGPLQLGTTWRSRVLRIGL